MKEIVIMMYYMECGGVENALISLLNYVDPKEYSVDLLLVEKKGAFLDRIPNWVNIIELDLSEMQRVMIIERSIHKTIEFGLKNRKIISTLLVFLRYSLCKIKSDDIMCAYRAILGNKKRYEYDIALDFHGYNSLTTYFLSQNITAKKKYTWVHSEKIAEEMGNIEFYLREYKKIFAVSERCVKKVKESLPPQYKDKVELFKNFIDCDRIRNLAIHGEEIKRKSKEIVILTVGRLSYPKGYDIAVESAKKLKQMNINFKWYFCGDGEEKNEILVLIQKYRLEENVILLGYQDNPYGFMFSCDIYVQPSRFEGYAVTITEAACLGCYIITTDVSGAREEIDNQRKGEVVAINAEALTAAIGRAIKYGLYIRKKDILKQKYNDPNIDSKNILKSILN